MAGHRSPVLRYAIAWIALLVLTAVTVLAADAPLGEYGIVAALGIAAVKAAVVLVVFMHFVEHPPVVRVVLATSVLFVFLLILFVQTDVMRRFPPSRPDGEGSPTRESQQAAAE